MPNTSAYVALDHPILQIHTNTDGSWITLRSKIGASIIVEADGREYLGTVTSARPYRHPDGTWTTVYTITFSQGCERGRVRVDAATLEECLRTRQPVWA